MDKRERALSLVNQGQQATIVGNAILEYVNNKEEEILQKAMGELMGGTLSDQSARDKIVSITTLREMIRDLSRKVERGERATKEMYSG